MSDQQPTDMVASDSVLPLEGITVVDFTQVLAGPFASMTLGDMGADVIKIEAVGRGDRCRSIEPSPEYFDTVNRNKRSIAVNVKTDEGQQVVRRLIEDADVFIESAKSGRMQRFNLAYNDVKPLNPNLIYCSVSGFGSESPYKDVPAWDMLIQAMSGIMSMTGERSGSPMWSGLPSGDLIAASYATQSILAALYARDQGKIDTEWIEVPMFDAAISWLSVRAGYSFGTGEPFPRLGTHHPSIAPFGVFECADDPIVIAAGTDSLWRSFCTALGQPDLADDNLFDTAEKRLENKSALREVIEPILADEPAQHWIDQCHDHEVPAGPIYDTENIWDDEHVKQRNLHRRMERDGREDADMIDHPIHFSELSTTLRSPPEDVGESTEAVLKEYGYSDATIARLQNNEIIE